MYVLAMSQEHRCCSSVWTSYELRTCSSGEEWCVQYEKYKILLMLFADCGCGVSGVMSLWNTHGRL